MASTIKLKNGSGAPLAGDLVQGEPALDLTNKRLYTENASGTVIEVGTNPSTIDINAGTIDGTVIGGSSAAAITGTTITGTSFVSSGDMTFGDSDKAIFGAGSDLQLYHTGSNSVIADTGTGNLIVRANDLRMTSYALEHNFLQANESGAVTLYHNNSAKLATTATGIDVTGTVTADGLTVDGSATIQASSSPALVVIDTTNNVEARLQAFNSTATVGTQSNHSFSIETNDTNRALFASNGDLSLFEDTGTTAKFFWDASAERLGVGTTSPATDIHIANSGAAQFLLQAGASDTSYFLMGDAADTNIGWIAYDNSNDSMNFRTNNAERMRIDSSGNLLVGKTASSASTVGVEARANGKTVSTVDDDYCIRANRLTGDGDILDFQKDGTTVGSIGTEVSDGTTPADLVITAGTINAARLWLKGGDSGLILDGHTNSVLPTDENSYEDNRTDLGSTSYRFKDLYLSGASYHGTTSGVIWTNTSGEGVVVSNDAIQVARSGDTALLLNRMTTTGKIQVFAQAGTEVGNVTVTASATAYNTSSDYRLKENVVSMDNASDRVLALNPVRFNFIADPEKTVDGFLAHEAQEVVPEAVHGVKDEVDDEGNPVYQGIDQSKLVPLLTKALQEALTEIADLKARVSALETN